MPGSEFGSLRRAFAEGMHGMAFRGRPGGLGSDFADAPREASERGGLRTMGELSGERTEASAARRRARGLKQGLEREREMPGRRASRRFGAETAERLAGGAARYRRRGSSGGGRRVGDRLRRRRGVAGPRAEDRRARLTGFARFWGACGLEARIPCVRRRDPLANSTRAPGRCSARFAWRPRSGRLASRGAFAHGLHVAEVRSRERLVDYYIYENWHAEGRNGKAVIHQGTCSDCNHGQGRSGGNYDRSKARWRGPYASLESARLAQSKMNVVHRRECGHCMNSS